MLVFGGYFVEKEELVTAFQSEVGSSNPSEIRAHLHQDFANNLRDLDVVAVYFPRGSQQEKFPGKEPAGGTLFQTRSTNSNFKYLKDCPDMEETDKDRETKKWLEEKGIKDPLFVTVPDPFFKYNEMWDVDSE